jgi:hypothetical protein
MTSPELITDEIVEKLHKAFYDDIGISKCALKAHRTAILAIQDDITRPVYNLLRGLNEDTQAYEKALREIRDYLAEKGYSYEEIEAHNMADRALKGEYHETDFTEYCEQNPITEE